MSTPAKSATVISMVPGILLASAGNSGTVGATFGSGGGIGGDGVDAETQRFVESKVETMRAQNDARFTEVLSEIRSSSVRLESVANKVDGIRPPTPIVQMFVGLVSALAVTVGLIFAILAYASDRFDGGLAAGSIKDQIATEQVKRDAAQDAKLDQIIKAVQGIQTAPKVDP